MISKLAAAVVLMGFSTVANAVEANNLAVKANTTKRVWTFFSCVVGASREGSYATAEHGQIVVRDTTSNRCGDPKFPVKEVWYTPNAGFKGVDELRTFARGKFTGSRKLIVQ